MVLLLAVGNRILASIPGMTKPFKTAAESLIILSLLSLGLFPFIWLACRPIPDPWFLPSLAIVFGVGLIYSFKKPPCPVPDDGKDTSGMIIVFGLVIILTWLPFSKIGSAIDGKLVYRAYFSSDYLKHFSVVESLNQGRIPPPNLFFKGEPLHYYWLPYTVPAFAARIVGRGDRAMFAFSFVVNFLFLLLLLQAAGGTIWGKKWRRYLALGFVLAPSLEGAYFLAVRSGFSLGRFFEAGRGVNIDALTRWQWNLPQVDTLLRSLLYTPQHLLSLAFLLLFLTLLPTEKSRPGLLSVALALSLAASFFIGGILFLSWTAYLAAREGIVLIQKKRRIAASLGLLARHLAPALVVLCIALALRMASFGGSIFLFKPLGPFQIFVLLGLNFGLLILGGVWGLLTASFPGRAFFSGLLATSLVFVLFVRIADFESDVSLKAGLIVILVCALLTSRAGAQRRPAKLFLPLALAIILPGSPTAILDIRNTADIHNSRFTSAISIEEMRMLEWIRRNIPADRTVQDFPGIRAWNLSTIPVFAGRQTVVGDRMHGRIFQVQPEAYEVRFRDLEKALAGLPGSAHELRRLGVDFLFWGSAERDHFKLDPGLPQVHRIGGTVLFSLLSRNP